jgi:hypothetical protein
MFRNPHSGGSGISQGAGKYSIKILAFPVDIRIVSAFS